MSRIAARLRSVDGPWLLGWLALSACFAAPLWSARVLPIHDLPNHLARITALHYAADPSWNVGAYYAPSLSPVPYFGHLYVVHLLTYLFGSVVRANLVYMTLYIFAAPLCGRVFAAATSRSPWLAFLLLPLSVCMFFQWGFIAFCVGVMLMLVACALLFRLLDEPTWRRALLLAVATAALYLCHILPWGAFGVFALVLVGVELAGRRVRPALIASAAMLPSLLLLALGILSARSFGYIHGQGYAAQSDTPAALLGHAIQQLNLWQDRSIDEWLQVALGVAVLALLVTDGGDADASGRVRARPIVAFVVFVLLAAATPFWIRQPFNWWMVNIRFFMMAVAVGIFLPRGPIVGARFALLGAALVAMLLLPVEMTRAYRSFSRKVEPLVALIERTPLGKNTLVLHTPRHGRSFTDPELAPGYAVWRELYNYPLVYRGGFDPYLYDDGFPVRRIHSLPAPRVESALVALRSFDETKLDPKTMLDAWDYFIAPNDDDELPQPGLERLARAGRWSLYGKIAK